MNFRFNRLELRFSPLLITSLMLTSFKKGSYLFKPIRLSKSSLSYRIWFYRQMVPLRSPPRNATLMTWMILSLLKVACRRSLSPLRSSTLN
ncbi:hypothetical protein RHMOL_Rhmol11G0088700 [Rhododendron molle]|uniref:Uncharacterized protein n=1 Tax=Rhododendron molle TaxID=49168 RepID=A0ACC0LQ31_RHOML|nr:hypothetical protein RHMOL_Rhmol11G0088700 [Rhododendron molle]